MQVRRLPAALALSALLSLAALPAGGQPASGGQVPALPRAAAAELLGLIDAPGVSGFEDPVRVRVKALLPSWATSRVDEAGNLLVTLGQGRPHTLVVTTVDEDGYVVSGITDEGYLRVQRVTTGIGHRLFEQFQYGQPALIQTRRGTFVPGVFATASTHLLRGREAMAAPRGLDDLWIDVGAKSRADVNQLGIQMLDPVSLRDRSQALAGFQVAGVAAQARAAALALADLLCAYDRAPAVTGTLTVAWAGQGQFGDRGVARLAQALDVDRVVAVVRHQVARGGEADPRGAAGRLGAGPLVPESDSATAQRASEKGIVVQAVPALRNPNAWPASKVQALALPVLFTQTTVETVDTRDIAALTRLVAAMAGLPDPRPAAPVGAVAPGAARPALDRTWPPLMSRMLPPLIDAYGVSNHEAAVREAVLRQLPAWAKPEVDDRGNVTVTVGPSGGAAMLFVAHMDEIGYELTGIRDDGTATVRKVGGFLDLLLEAHPVLVHTARGPVPAVVAPRPNYLRASEATPAAADIALYFGTGSRQETEALGVARGDTATVRKQLVPLANGRATARSMDDRCGVAALIAALERLDPSTLTNRVTFAWDIAEETGLVGAGVVAERTHPPVVFAVDTFVSSDSPLDPQRLAYILLGSGAVIRAMDNSVITPPAAVARVAEVARAHRIPVSVGTTQGGNDGSQFSKYGSTVIPLSWPGRYSHSAVEVMDSHDLGALVDLIVALAEGF